MSRLTLFRILTAMCFLLHPIGLPAPAAETGSTASEEQAIRDQAERFQKAFSQGQASAIADLYADDCSQTTSEGQKFVGREEIRKLYERCFKGMGVHPAYVSIDSITFPAPDVCIEEGSFFISEVNDQNRYTVVHIKRDGKWLMSRVTESPYNPNPADALKPLQWLAGTWTVKSQNKTVLLTVHPVAHDNFLMMSFSDDASQAGPAPDEVQLIGWSFKTKDIVSWHFSRDGGVGFGHWQPSGNNWIVDTKGVVRDGSETMAKYQLEVVDRDHFRWRSLGRMINGEEFASMPPLDIVRNK